MAIRGLTDPESVLPAFRRIGKLRKGAPKGDNAKRPGKDLDYFRFTGDRPEIEAAFTEKYGREPRMLTVYLPYPGVAENFPTWKELWKGGGLVHRCDGCTKLVHLEANGKYSTVPKPCDTPCYSQDAPCGAKPVGRLSVILPELWRKGFLGFVTMETHGKHDCRNISASLMQAAEAARGRPQGLAGIRMSLYRSLEDVSTPRPDGTRVHEKKWLVRLEPEAEWAQLQLEAASRAAMLAIEAPHDKPEGMADGVVIDGETGEVLGDLERDDDDDDDTPDDGAPHLQALPSPEWLNDPEKVAAVKAKAKAAGLTTAAEVLTALGNVHKLSECRLDFDAAIVAVTDAGMAKALRKAKAQEAAA